MQSKNVLQDNVFEGFSKPFSSNVLESSSFIASSVTKTIRWNNGIFYRSISGSSDPQIVVSNQENLGESVTTTGLPLIPRLEDLDETVTPQFRLTMRETKPPIRQVEPIEMPMESTTTSSSTGATTSTPGDVQPMDLDSPAIMDEFIRRLGEWGL